jgi:hypothetical protein
MALEWNSLFKNFRGLAKEFRSKKTSGDGNFQKNLWRERVKSMVSAMADILFVLCRAFWLQKRPGVGCFSLLVCEEINYFYKNF